MTLPSPSTPPPPELAPEQPALPQLAPAPAPAPAPAAAPVPPAPVRFPLGWILDHAAAPVQYRAIVDVARLPLPEASLSSLPLSYEPALDLALQQQADGTWRHAMLGIPSSRAQHFEGVGTIPAVRRLLEYGWDQNTPPLLRARRLLFRLLAEDEDPAFLFELAGKGAKDAGDPALARRGRTVLREAAAAALAQAGYGGDPRLRGAARRILERIGTFLRSPLAAKPFVRVGNQHVLAQEATPPSIYAVTMLAHMPLFRTEHHDVVDRLYHYLSQPLPRQEPVQLFGKHVVEQPHLLLGDQLSTRNTADADIPAALLWLELMARLGFLRRNEGWTKLFERFLDDRDAQGVWHPRKGTELARSADGWAWAMYPLDEGRGPESRFTDVTFRLGLIARLSGRPIELE